MRWVTKKRGNHGRVLLKEKLALNYRVKAYTSLSSHRRRIGEDRPYCVSLGTLFHIR